ncbi:MAG: hypothetical protein RI898_741 [Actinomycetota bacterium]
MNTTSTQSIAYARRWWVLAVLAISVFLVVVDNLIVNVALPTLQSELNATTTSLQWIVDSYALVFAGLLLAGGGIGDRYGRKRTLQIGLVLFAACSGMAAFASTTNSLIFWRGAMGIGAALVFPATLAIITNLFVDPIERAKAIGLWFWWGSVFLINLPIVAISLIAGARLIPDSRNPDAHALDKIGFLLSVIAIGSLVFTVIESPHWGWGSQKSNLGFGIAVLTLIGFVLFESKKEAPLLEVTFFKSARFSAATGSIGIAFFCLFGFTFLVTQYFQFVRGYDTLSAGLHTIPFAVGAGVTAPLAARAALKFGTKRIVALGLFNMSVGLLIASRMDADSSYWGHVIISMVLMANGLSFVTSPSTDAVMGSLPREKAGVGSAVNDISREVGGTLGVAVVGSVFVSLYTPQLMRSFEKIPGLIDGLNKTNPELYPMAQDSVGAAFAISQQTPAGLQPLVINAVSDSFVHGFQAASLVGAGMALVGAIFALKFLPARPTADDSLTILH